MLKNTLEELSFPLCQMAVRCEDFNNKTRPFTRAHVVSACAEMLTQAPSLSSKINVLLHV